MRRRASERRVLDEAGGIGAMTGVMAIMVFLTVLAAALGLGTAGAARLLTHDLAGRVTVQVVEGDPVRRDALTARIARTLRGQAEVRRVQPVAPAELARLLRPWLGEDGADPALPMPALIDATLRDDAAATLSRVTAAVRRVAPAARIDRHESWMAPVGGLLHTTVLLAAGLVALMAAATAAVVMLAARAGLQTHRATLEVMHMLGSTDVQVARLFQRRVALDAAIGGGVGALAALAVTSAVQAQVAGLGSDLLGGAALTRGDWAVLIALPFAFVALAMLAARLTVVRALGRML
ncbi:cell division transport system permease protein [Sphingomonas gellani]|uniref:Cell division transport system permease protein n=1 Tax=Sphingomonas gellani TaxID=1166340 RepID=A0A1H8CK64_9SPHN|nr:permease [Sphingomonas gellani]SEM94477.1 cell division transport system permease protein [Sphingomonas gellani]